MFGKKLKGNFKNLLKGAKKYENQEFLNGAVALSLKVAFALAVAGADGEMEKVEIKAIKDSCKLLGVSTNKFGL